MSKLAPASSNQLLASLPEGWQRTKFGIEFQESNERNGDNPPGPLLSISEYRGVELNTRTDGQQPSADVSNYRVVRPNQLAANMMWLNHGGLGVSDTTGYMSPAYKAFWISDNFEPRYVHHLLRSQLYVGYFGAMGTGVRPNSQMVTKVVLDATPLPLPPLEAQRRIANYLDREIGRIDAVIDKLDGLASQLIDRKSAFPDNTLSGLYGKKTVPLWSILEPVRDQGFPNEEVLSVYRDYGVIVKSSRDDNINTTPENLNPYQLVLPGDVVINKMKAWQGSLGVSEHRGIVSPDYQVARPKVELHPRYIHSVLRAPRMISQYRNRSIGVRPAQWRLYWDEMSTLHIPLPPLEEQRRIATHLDEVASKIDAMLAKVAQLKDLLTERRAALITDVVTGRKDVA